MDRDKLAVLAVSESGFIFDPVTGHSYTANATGLRILELLKTGKEPDEIRSVSLTSMTRRKMKSAWMLMILLKISKNIS
jgi:hypothetical protein